MPHNSLSIRTRPNPFEFHCYFGGLLLSQRWYNCIFAGYDVCVTLKIYFLVSMTQLCVRINILRPRGVVQVSLTYPRLCSIKIQLKVRIFKLIKPSICSYPQSGFYGRKILCICVWPRRKRSKQIIIHAASSGSASIYMNSSNTSSYPKLETVNRFRNPMYVQFHGFWLYPSPLRLLTFFPVLLKKIWFSPLYLIPSILFDSLH